MREGTDIWLFVTAAPSRFPLPFVGEVAQRLAATVTFVEMHALASRLAASPARGIVLDLGGLTDVRLVAATRTVAHGLPIATIVDAGAEALGLASLRAGADDAFSWADLAPESLAAGLTRLAVRSAAEDPCFRVLLERSSIAAGLVSGDAITRWVSPAMEKLFGYGADEVVGRPGGLFTHPDDLARLTDDFAALFALPGITRTYEFRVRHGDGSWRWVECISTNLLDDPSVHAIVTNCRDVTDRKAAEDAVREARARLAYLLSATDAVTYTCRPDGDFGATFISDNITALLGYQPDDFVHDSAFWIDHIHPEDRPQVLAGLAHLFQHDHHVHEYRFADRSGAWRWMHDELRVVRDAAGEPSELIGFWIDVTARHEMEDSLRRSEANFRLLIELSPTAMAVASRDGRIVYANPACLKLLGYDRVDELVGRAPLDVVHPDDRERARRRIERLPRVRRNSSYEQRFVRRDGKVVCAEVESIDVVFDGQPAGLMLARDITERRELLARLAVTDRMASLGTLAAGVAHEINNPLAYVITNLSLLSQELCGARERSARDPEIVRTMLKDALEGAARVHGVVRDLRMLSRPDDQPQPTDVRAVLGWSLKMLHNEIRHRARLVEEYEEVPLVQGDESRLGQVFVNLLVNAAQAIPDGNANHHVIRVRARAASPARVVVEVSDTGGGIAPENLGRIFDPFFTTKPIGSGTGLGLSICHGIVKSLGGDITVESELGGGTTFRVALPVASQPRAPDQVADVAGPPRPGRVLVIDDEPAIGRSLGLLLGGEHTVECVTSARLALARLDAGERFDAIICDLMMPDMNGMEFHDEVIRVSPADAARIVFLTGGAFTATAREFLARVPNTVLEKPFDPRALRTALLHCLQS